MKPNAIVPFPRSTRPPIRIHSMDDAIRMQLSKILSSAGFVRAERMKRFLEFVVDETLGGRADDLCEYSIGLSVFQRGESFEPAIDPIVRNDARRLRHKLLEYYQSSPCVASEQIVIEIPKGGYAPAFRFPADLKTTSEPRRYRLVASLVRIDHDSEVWTADHEFQITESSDEPYLALQLQIKVHLPRPAVAPISRSSDQLQIWSKSRERVSEL